MDCTIPIRTGTRRWSTTIRPSPDIHGGPDNDYWDHVDYIVKKANSLGIVIGFLPTWGDKWNKKWGAGPEIFTPDNAEVYGQWLGARYRDADIVWILGGDRPIENDTHREIIRRMALGLHKGDGGTHLHTFHPTGRQRFRSVLSRRPVARFQHAAERTRARVHRPLRPDARGLRSRARQTGARRRADL